MRPYCTSSSLLQFPYIISEYFIVLGLLLPDVLVTDNVNPASAFLILKCNLSSFAAVTAVLPLFPNTLSSFLEYSITTSLLFLIPDVNAAYLLVSVFSSFITPKLTK